MHEVNGVTDNVVNISFRRRSKEDLPDPPVKKTRRRSSRAYCGNHFFEYDMDERSVSCTRCGRSFDAFEALDHLGRNWERYDFNHRNARREIADLEKEREAVAKQVKNLKARKSRLVPAVRQDVERLRGELRKCQRETNADMAKAVLLAALCRVDKIMRTLEAFGEDECVGDDEDRTAVSSSDVHHDASPRRPTRD